MFNIDTTTRDFMTVVTTHVCNMACRFCIDQYRGREEFISRESVINACLFASSQGIQDMLLVGGEPTMHPDIRTIASIVRGHGFNVIVTTNYRRPDVIKKLDEDRSVDSFNISWYHQKELPKQSDFIADLTLSALIFRGQLDTREKLDKFIDEHSDSLILKFSTLAICNQYTAERQHVGYLDELPGERVVLFDEIMGQFYRDCLIKRHDRIVNISAHQSYKCHVDGRITTSWNRPEIDQGQNIPLLSGE